MTRNPSSPPRIRKHRIDGNRTVPRDVQLGMRVERATRTRVAAVAAAVTIAALALAGCNVAAGTGTARDAGAQPSGPASSGPVNVTSPEVSGPPAGGSPAPAPSSTVQPPDSKTPPPASGGPQGDVVLTGSVHAGAEPTCLLLTWDKIEYLLLTPQITDLRDGAQVTVVGHVEHGIMTHCQQGMPFQVDKIVSVTGP